MVKRFLAALLLAGAADRTQAQTGSLAPTPLAFGSQSVTTQSAARSITVANTHASASFQVNAYSNNNSTRFPLVGGTCGPAPFTLVAGASCTIDYAFAPDTSGGHSAGFSIGGTTPQVTFMPSAVTLTGTGTALPVTLAPTPLAFGNQTVTTQSAPASITVANTHASASLRVDAYSNNNPTRFPVVGGTCGPAPFTLVAGASCTIDHAFAPDATGGHSAGFTIGGTTPQTTVTPASVTLTGTGTAVPLALTPSTLSFGNQTVTTQGASQVVTLTNTHGSAALQVNGYSNNNPTRFVLAGGTCGAAPFALAAGASCTIAYAFRPDTTGGHSAGFQIGGTTPQTAITPASVTLSGTGTAVPATLAPASVGFASQTVTTQGATQSITLANSHASASFRVDAYSNNNPSRFPLVGGSCGPAPFTLAAGASCTIAYAFRPDTTGGHSAGFTIGGTTPQAAVAPASVTLSGTGLAVPLVLSPATLAFGEVPRFAASAPRFVSIGNAATEASVTVVSVSLNGTAFRAVTQGSCASLPFALDPGASCTLALVFAPDTEGGHSAAFAIATTTPQSTVQPASVTLTGVGGPDRLFSDGFEAP